MICIASSYGVCPSLAVAVACAVLHVRVCVSLFLRRVTNCLVYYSLAMRSADLGNNRYVSFAISGLVELPAYFLAYKLLNR